MKSEKIHDKQAGLPTATTDPLRTLTDRIVQNFQPIRLILFGSHARGDANPHSDIDLLVVFSQAPDKRKAAIEIRRALADLPVCKDVIVTTPDEIEESRAVQAVIMPRQRSINLDSKLDLDILQRPCWKKACSALRDTTEEYD